MDVVDWTGQRLPFVFSTLIHNTDQEKEWAGQKLALGGEIVCLFTPDCVLWPRFPATYCVTLNNCAHMNSVGPATYTHQNGPTSVSNRIMVLLHRSPRGHICSRHTQQWVMPTVYSHLVIQRYKTLLAAQMFWISTTEWSNSDIDCWSLASSSSYVSPPPARQLVEITPSSFSESLYGAVLIKSASTGYSGSGNDTSITFCLITFIMFGCTAPNSFRDLRAVK